MTQPYALRDTIEAAAQNTLFFFAALGALSLIAGQIVHAITSLQPLSFSQVFLPGIYSAAVFCALFFGLLFYRDLPFVRLGIALAVCGALALCYGAGLAAVLINPPDVAATAQEISADAASSDAELLKMFGVAGGGTKEQADYAPPLLPGLPAAFSIVAGLFGGFCALAVSFVMLRPRFFPSPHPGFSDLAARRPYFSKLAEVFERDVRPVLTPLEPARRKAVITRFSVYALSVPAIIFSVRLDLFLALIVTAAAIVAAELPLYRLRQKTRAVIGAALARALSLEYAADAQTPDVEEFTRLGILPRFRHGEGRDRFAGTHNGVGFRFWRALLVDRRSDMPVIVFSGIVAELVFPGAFEGRIRILVDRGRALGRFLTGTVLREGERRVNLANTAFEKRFEVYGTDQMQAHALLTPDVVENIVRLSQILSGGAHLQAAFEGNRMLIVVDYARRAGSFDMRQSMGDPSRVCHFADEVGVIYDIIDTIGVHKKPKR